MTTQHTSLPLAQDDAGSGCGCGCSTSSTSGAAATGTTRPSSAAATAVYLVTGMTCGHCVNAVSSELRQLPGVTGVEVDLVAAGTSTVTVTSAAPLSEEQVTAALDEAGDYHLAN